MKFNIIEEECKELVNINSQPLSFRLKLKIEGGDLILLKQYFRSGFYSGENWDNFNVVKMENSLCWVSIITRNFDIDYLNSLEKKIFKKFKKESEILSNKLREDLENNIKYMNKCIIKQDNVTDFVTSFDRIRKITKLKMLIK